MIDKNLLQKAFDADLFTISISGKVYLLMGIAIRELFTIADAIKNQKL
jgi:hypothetical protein